MFFPPLLCGTGSIQYTSVQFAIHLCEGYIYGPCAGPDIFSDISAIMELIPQGNEKPGTILSGCGVRRATPPELHKCDRAALVLPG